MRMTWIRKDFVAIILTAISQIVLGYFTLFIQAIYPVWSAPFWPASGAALAALLIRGPRMLLGVYLGLAVLGLKFFWGPYPFWMAFVVPLGNLAETSLAFFLFRHFVPKFDPGFGNIRQLAFFILLCPWIPALTSALTIHLLLQYLGTVPTERFFSEIAVYSLGNATGILLITPLVLVWRDLPRFSWKTPLGIQVLGLLGTMAMGLWLYSGLTPPWGRLLSVGLIPLIVWGIWTTGIRGATIACVLGSVCYFAMDVPGSRPLSQLLELRQQAAEKDFAMEKQLHREPGMQPPARLTREISDQIGLLAVICITILPLGVAADELRQKAYRDRMAMAALSSSFWRWAPETGNEIEDPNIARLLLPWASLFRGEKKAGSLQIRSTNPAGPTLVSHWSILETDPAGRPLKVVGLLQDYSIEEERDTAVAQARLAELEIKTLRSHLNPHLLFNCLTGLRGMIAEDPEKAREFSGNLARFLRAVVDSEKRKTIPLREELAICTDFSRLEELRGRPVILQTSLTPNDGDILIPPLTLVTLLENAAKHGHRNHAGFLPIEITSYRPTSGQVAIQVRQPGSLRPRKDGANHAGLDLIRRQIAMVFGEGGHLNLKEEPSGHVVAELLLPA